MIIDGIILGIVGGLLFSGTRGGTASGIVTFLVGITYNWYFLTQQNGQTLGKRMMGIRVVKTNNRR